MHENNRLSPRHVGAGLFLCAWHGVDLGGESPLYRAAAVENRGEKKARLAKLLSMSPDTINRWLSRIDKGTREERSAAVQNLYLQCHTQEKIAEAVGMPQQSVADLLPEIRNYGIPVIPGQFAEDLESKSEKQQRKIEERRQKKIVETNKDNLEHALDFQIPIYNVWKQREKTEGLSHFGNSDVRWVDNLLYLYTKPFDTVVDPFAGGGSTLDICNKRFRRCWVSDRLPIEERKNDIREIDVVEDGLPDLRKRWSVRSRGWLPP